MAILYNIEKVVLTELDPSTGDAKASGIVTAIDTAQKAELEAVISEGDEDILRSAKEILAVVRTDDLIYGYDLKLTDNTFSAKAAQLVAGYKVEGASKTEKWSTPLMSEGFTGKPFKCDIYVANYKGDAIENYCQITLNKCIGKFPSMDVGDGFYAPEFEIKARENTKANKPIKELTFVDTIPEVTESK
nr:MAG TPA: hypothetical protein [Caudoviricetes sp.]